MTTATRTLGGRERPSPVLAPSALAGIVAELKSRRIELGLSRAQVGACIYRSGEAIHDWETGRWNPPADLLAEWARVLKFELGLYEPVAAPSPTASVGLLLTEVIHVLARALLEQDDD